MGQFPFCAVTKIKFHIGAHGNTFSQYLPIVFAQSIRRRMGDAMAQSACAVWVSYCGRTNQLVTWR
jgi:hypothetical protein